VDINEDNNKDLELSVHIIWGHSDLRYSELKCLSDYKVALATVDHKFYSDTLPLCCDSIYYVKSDTVQWKNSIYYLSFYYNPGTASGYTINGLWNFKSDKYLPLRRITNGDTLYAWVKMSVTNYTCMEIKSVIYERTTGNKFY
jgi:hypothetical protein